MEGKIKKYKWLVLGPGLLLLACFGLYILAVIGDMPDLPTSLSNGSAAPSAPKANGASSARSYPQDFYFQPPGSTTTTEEEDDWFERLGCDFVAFEEQVYEEFAAHGLEITMEHVVPLREAATFTATLCITNPAGIRYTRDIESDGNYSYWRKESNGNDYPTLGMVDEATFVLCEDGEPRFYSAETMQQIESPLDLTAIEPGSKVRMVRHNPGDVYLVYAESPSCLYYFSEAGALLSTWEEESIFHFSSLYYGGAFYTYEGKNYDVLYTNANSSYTLLDRASGTSRYYSVHAVQQGDDTMALLYNYNTLYQGDERLVEYTALRAQGTTVQQVVKFVQPPVIWSDGLTPYADFVQNRLVVSKVAADYGRDIAAEIHADFSTGTGWVNLLFKAEDMYPREADSFGSEDLEKYLCLSPNGLYGVRKMYLSGGGDTVWKYLVLENLATGAYTYLDNGYGSDCNTVEFLNDKLLVLIKDNGNVYFFSMDSPAFPSHVTLQQAENIWVAQSFYDRADGSFVVLGASIPGSDEPWYAEDSIYSKDFTFRVDIYSPTGTLRHSLLTDIPVGWREELFYRAPSGGTVTYQNGELHLDGFRNGEGDTARVGTASINTNTNTWHNNCQTEEDGESG